MSTSKLTAEDVGHRVLALIEGIRSADDITPQKLEKAMGMTVEFNKENPNVYGFGAQITEVWSYSLITLPETDGSAPKRLMLSFDDQTGENADRAAVCGIDFDAYSNALRALGFTPEPQHGEHGMIMFWKFTRDKVSVDLSSESESDKNPQHGCVSMLIINV